MLHKLDRCRPTCVSTLFANDRRDYGCYFWLGFYLWAQQPIRTTLYAGLPEAEKSRVIDALKNSGVDVSLDPVTGDVLVPMAVTTAHA